jgi:serine/threonine protein kinase
MNAEALIGTVLGTCTLKKLVGQGGMGAVYLAQQSRPKRQVAVKVLLPMRPLNPNQLAAFLERFRRETDAAASMEHPNIMPVHEYGEREGLAYLVMPYVSGGTLRDELERWGALPLEKVASYLEQIAAAIDFAHEHGVIHRDIKPANIMMTPEGRLLLADFGLVKIVADGQSAQVRITGVGAPVGTPDYMSPEQVIGEEVDVRADLYSLGVVLYQMVTGTTPFRGETPMQIAAQHLQVPPPSAQIMRPDLPVGAEQVLQRALAKRPADRYESAQDLADAFRTALVNSGIQLNVSYSAQDFLSGSMTGRFAVPKGQFEPLRRQTISMPRLSKAAPALHNTDRQAVTRAETEALPVDLQRQTGSVPAVSKAAPALQNTGRQASIRREAGALPVDPQRQTGSVPAVSKAAPALQNTGRQAVVHREVGALPVDPPYQTASVPVVSSRPVLALHNTDRPVTTRREAEALPAPALSLDPPQLSGGVLLRTRKKPVESTSTYSLVRPDLSQGQNGGGLLSRTGKFPMVGAAETSVAVEPVPSQVQGSSKCGVHSAPHIAGVAAELVPQSQLDPTRNLTLTLRMKIALLIAVIVLIAVGLAGFLWFTHNTHAYAPAASTPVVTTMVL